MFQTKVITMQIPNRHNWYLVFGQPLRVNYHHSNKSGARFATTYFSRDSIFGYSVQRKNRHGLVSWNTYFVRAVSPGEPAHQIAPGIIPSAECLVIFRGRAKSELAKKYLALLKCHSLNPAKPEVAELHRQAAAYLMAGTLPETLISNFVASRSSHVAG